VPTRCEAWRWLSFKLLSDGKQQHKINLIGRPYQQGSLEHCLGTTLDAETRQLADRAFDALKAKSFIRPTYGDLVNPELWVEITPTGQDALARGVLDELDFALFRISPHLAEMRAGAWEAVHSGRADSLRQAAHSGRELIDQVLKEGTADDQIKAQANFVADHSSLTGVTRKHRLKFLMKKFKETESASALAIAETAIDLIIAVDDRLKGASHARGVPSKQDIVDALNTAEVALRALLV
jgi:hypothetical protein